MHVCFITTCNIIVYFNVFFGNIANFRLVLRECCYFLQLFSRWHFQCFLFDVIDIFIYAVDR